MGRQSSSSVISPAACSKAGCTLYWYWLSQYAARFHLPVARQLSLQTTTGPVAAPLPSPVPRANTSPTTCTLIRLVVPGTPTGTPAVSTTRSPFLIKPAFKAAAIEALIISSVLVAPKTDVLQDRFSLRATSSLIVKAIIGSAADNGTPYEPYYPIR